MISEKTSRIKFLAKDGTILVSIGRDFKGLPLPSSGYSDLKNGLAGFTPEKEIQLESSLLLDIHIDETMAIISNDGKYFIEVIDGGKVFSDGTEIVKVIANNDGKYICIGKVIGDTPLPTSGYVDLQDNEYIPFMSINYEALVPSSVFADFKDLILSSNGDVFVKATLINN